MTDQITPINAQPCDNFRNPERDPEGLENAHQCPHCGGIRRYCENCRRDHHDGGWENCYLKQLKFKTADFEVADQELRELRQSVIDVCEGIMHDLELLRSH